jgi:hypothetical protein
VLPDILVMFGGQRVVQVNHAGQDGCHAEMLTSNNAASPNDKVKV